MDLEGRTVVAAIAELVVEVDEVVRLGHRPFDGDEEHADMSISGRFRRPEGDLVVDGAAPTAPPVAFAHALGLIPDCAISRAISPGVSRGTPPYRPCR